MTLKEIGGPNHELLPVREVKGALEVDCPQRGAKVPLETCRSCPRGTVVRLKGSGLPYLLCPNEGPPMGALVIWPRDPVRSIMTKAVPVKPALSIGRLVRLFAEEEVGAAPVVDELGRLTGMVTKADLSFDDIGWTELRDAALSQWPEGSDRYADLMSEDELYLYELLRDRTVGDVMSRDRVWVSPEVSVSAAAEVMTKSGLHQLPVVGADDVPVGMVSADALSEWLSAQR